MDADQELHALFDRLLAAWTAGDATAYGACFTTDCDYVSYDGTRATGVGPMVANHDTLFRGVLSGSSLVGQIEAIRYLGPDVALVHAFASVRVAWRRDRPVTIPAIDSVPSRMARGLARLAGASPSAAEDQSTSPLRGAEATSTHH